ncbi:MAG: tRNA pseudouridine(55) synthase TruB [Candidatus Margulisbacteria bacterium]|nr:tRNA pseudouridine(55) synthase TruB [Candidatus Margulisiibacteriota bacterium]
MEGIILVDKPRGITSFDVIARIRRFTGVRKVGHSGTLDPMATGLLPVFVGKSVTKQIKHFMGADKGYEGEMTLGVRTDTMDSEGKELECQISNVKTCENEILKLFQKFTGKIMQKPPMFSAKKVNGQRLYKLARKGLVVDVPPKEVEIHRLELLSFKGNIVKFRVLCSKGTYVRSLVSDIGNELGYGAHLSSLRRIYAHPFVISQAITLETIENLTKIGKLDSIMLRVEEFL